MGGLEVGCFFSGFHSVFLGVGADFWLFKRLKD